MGKELLYISVVSFLIVLSWIAFDIYHVVTKSTISSAQQQLTTPLTPQFDHEIILKVLERGLPSR